MNPFQLSFGSHNSNDTYGYKFHLVPLLVLLIVCLVAQLNSITNVSMPSGDGNRIMPNMEFIQNSGEFIPLWNPSKFAGMPFLADPERFLLLSKFVSSESAYAYLQINLTLILIGYLTAVVCYFLAQKFAISRAGALVSAILLVVSQFHLDLIKSARIDGLFSTFFLILIFYLYLQYVEKKSPFVLLGICILVAIELNLGGYYLAAELYPFLLLIGFNFNSGTFYQKIYKTVSHLIIFSTLGVLIGSVYLLPLLDYSFTQFSATKPLTTLADSQPIPGSLMNIFIPLSVQHIGGGDFVFYHVSFILVFLLPVYWITRKSKPWPYETLFAILFFFGLVFNLGKMFPFSLIVDFVTELPLLKQIRWAYTFWFSSLIAMIILSGAAIDRIRVLDSVDMAWKKLIIVISVLLSAILCLDLVYSIPSLWSEINNDDFFSFRRVAEQPVLILFFLIPFLAAIYFPDKKYRPLLVVLVIAVPLIFFRPYSEMHRLKNQDLPDQYKDYLLSDQSEFRVSLLNKGQGNQIGIPKISNLNGFSMYFSNEHREMLGRLYGREISELRPHWVRPLPSLELWDNLALDLLNIKYVEIKKSDLNDAIFTKWDSVAEAGRSILLKRKHWSSALKFYGDCDVRTGNKKLKDMLTDSSVYSKTLWISSDSREVNIPDCRAGNIKPEATITIVERSANTVQFSVKTNLDGFLYIPEYFDQYWKADLNGSPTPVFRAFDNFRAIQVSTGENSIKMFYSPDKFYLGLWISLSTLTLLLIYSLASWRMKRKENLPSST
jgi:hypothetical protein